MRTGPGDADVEASTHVEEGGREERAPEQEPAREEESAASSSGRDQCKN